MSTLWRLLPPQLPPALAQGRAGETRRQQNEKELEEKTEKESKKKKPRIPMESVIDLFEAYDDGIYN